MEEDARGRRFSLMWTQHQAQGFIPAARPWRRSSVPDRLHGGAERARETFNVAEHRGMWFRLGENWNHQGNRTFFCVLFKLMVGQNNIWRLVPARMLRNCPLFFPASIPFRALVSAAAVTGGQLLTPWEAVATNKHAALAVLVFLITTRSPELTGFQCWRF